MAITTLDQMVAGMQPTNYIIKGTTPTLVAGRAQSLWPLAGLPGAGAYDTTLNGVNLSSTSAQVAGQIPFTDPTVGQTAYLARLQAMVSQPGIILLCDRLWHNGGMSITSTSGQSIVSPTFPARDKAGSTNGDGVLLGVELSVASGAGTPTITIGYTNQAGTSGRTGTNIVATTASSAIGAFYQIALQSGDTGVRSVQSLTLSATWTSGTINLVAYRVLAALEVNAATVPNAIDALTGGFPTLYAGTVPFLLFIPSTTTATTFAGQVTYSHG